MNDWLASNKKPDLPQALKIREGFWGNSQAYARQNEAQNNKVFYKVNNCVNEHIKTMNQKKAWTLPVVNNPPFRK